jgi:hypothetical protein
VPRLAHPGEESVRQQAAIGLTPGGHVDAREVFGVRGSCREDEEAHVRKLHGDEASIHSLGLFAAGSRG